MNSTRQLARFAVAGLIASALTLAAGCDDKKSPPPPNAGPGTNTGTPPAGGGTVAGSTSTKSVDELAGRASSGSRLDSLAEEPKSLLGRSAKTAKNVADQMENKQAEAAALADEVNASGAPFELAGLKWIVPTGWEKKPPASEMRAAEFHITGDNNETALVTFSHFPGGQGGNPESNLERWKSQFRSPESRTKNRTVAGCKIHSIDVVGTYMDGMPGSGKSVDRPDYAMRGVIIEGPSGFVFIKMTGPFEVVNSTRDSWYQLVDGMTKK